MPSPPPCPSALFDDAPPFHSENLAVPGGHRLRISQHGQPQGLPALLLHGGPGSGCSPLLRRFFNPALFRIICVDQRGAGDSRPAGGTQHNTTADLLADLRRVREHLAIKRWLVVGGSWGATLALAHAADPTQQVSGLLLRAPFLARAGDIAAFFAASAAHSPQAAAAWQALAALCPQALPDGTQDPAAKGQPPAPDAGLLPAIVRGLEPAPGSGAGTMPDGSPGPLPDPLPITEYQRQLALAWWAWEQALSRDQAPGGAQASPSPAPAGAPGAPPPADHLVARYRVQSHYLRHGCWLQSPSLLDLARQVAARPIPPVPIPTLLLQGSADRICPPAGAALLQQALPHSRLHSVAGAGHDPSHPAMAAAMVAALQCFAETGHFETGHLKAGAP